jgi:hypothetical protein
VSDTCQYPTLLWNLYDMCRKAGVQFFFFTRTLLGLVSDTCKTFVQHVSDKYPKEIFFFASTFFRHIPYIFTKVNDASKQQCISMRNYILYILITIFLAFSLVGGWIKIKYYPILFWNFFIMQLVAQLRCTFWFSI